MAADTNDQQTRTDWKRICSGHSSRTGRPCRAPCAFGTNVCVAHGARAPQTKAAGLRRLAQAEASRALAKRGAPVPVTDPLSALQALAGRCGALLDHAQQQYETSGSLEWLSATKSFVSEARSALSDLSRLMDPYQVARATVQSRLDDEDLAKIKAAVIAAMSAADVTEAQQARFYEAIAVELAALEPGDGGAVETRPRVTPAPVRALEPGVTDADVVESSPR